MSRIVFDRALGELQEQILYVGSRVEKNLPKSADCLVRRDMNLARTLVAIDKEINAKRIQIEMNSLSLIARQQPMAGDMRRLATMIEVVGELERIHDYVKGIASITLVLGEEPLPEVFANILPLMAEKTKYMLHDAIDAFIHNDAVMARAIPRQDDEVDRLFNQAYQELVHCVAADFANVDRMNKLEWAAHNMERAADRVINICEWIVYMATGVYKEFETGHGALSERR